ncbi:hypothetical protein ACIO93_24465 [Streptomyces sp. NPDC087903]|uniref:hypothetical protein n=1 Tax=Streptomyces sp. NPDC087903 TaxID=3365819 RepID=UPI0038017F58
MISLMTATEQQGALPAAAFVAACALVFTVASFWWLNARQGRLKSWEPLSFAAGLSESQSRFRFPVVLYNTAAKPIVVQDFRLSFPDESPPVAPLPWTSTRSHLRPENSDELRLPASFAVAGRTAEQLFVEFGTDLPRWFIPESRDYRLTIEARLGHRREWQPLVTFTWHAARVTNTAYIAYRNSIDDLSEQKRADGEAALRALAAKVEAKARAQADQANASGGD